jgi:two-component system chemotaxis response regulator CheB
MVLVVASTGGPDALLEILRHIVKPMLPMIVAQHMPADQTKGFAMHLADRTRLAVLESGAGVLPLADVVVLRGGGDYRLHRGETGLVARLAPADDTPFHPNGDTLLRSAAAALMPAGCVVLSGMGQDGAAGAAALASSGMPVLVQAFGTCVVPGMPQATAAIVPGARSLSPASIAARLNVWARSEAA